MFFRVRRIFRNARVAGGFTGRKGVQGVFVAALVLLAGSLFLGGCDRAGGPPASPPLQEVTVIAVEPRRVELTTELSGRTSALEFAEVRPQVSGIILERLFTEGAEVTKGQQLYQIDPALYQAALNEARAALARAQANAKKAKLLADRYGEVVSSRAVSRQEYDDALAAHAQARADVAASTAAVERAAINVQYTKVYSPIDGHIGISTVTPGALVTANQPQPLATVQRLDEMYVDVSQSSADILRLKRALMEGRLVTDTSGGAKVTLTLEDGSEYNYEGVLQLADVSVDRGTGSVMVRARFPNPRQELGRSGKDRILFPGMFVRAVLQEAVSENALMLPVQAVGRDTMGRATVYVLGDDNTTIREEVLTLDRTIGNEYLVLSGLKKGDRVVVDGRVKIRPGAKVRAIPYQPAGNASASQKSQAGSK